MGAYNLSNRKIVFIINTGKCSIHTWGLMIQAIEAPTITTTKY